MRGVFNTGILWGSSEITTAPWPVCYTTVKKIFRSYIIYTVEINRTKVEVISRFAEGRIKGGILFRRKNTVRLRSLGPGIHSLCNMPIISPLIAVFSMFQFDFTQSSEAFFVHLFISIFPTFGYNLWSIQC